MAKVYQCDCCKKIVATRTGMTLWACLSGAGRQEYELCADCHLKIMKVINREVFNG